MENKIIPNLFKWLEEITYYKTPVKQISEESYKSYSPYMINRYLSMNPDYIHIVNFVQKLNLESKGSYVVYKDLIPKKKLWLKYIKNTNKLENYKDLEDIIIKAYEVSKRESHDIIKILGKEGINNLLTQQGYEIKEIKSLLKIFK